MSTTSTAIFTGTSRFTNDFQQVITRSVAIASLPITQLNNVKNALSDQATEVGTLSNSFSSLQTAIQNLQNATGLNSLTSNVSDSAVATVSLAQGAAPASYSLEVQSLGSFTNTLSSSSLTSVTDPTSQNLSSSSSFSVTVNGVSTQISPATKTLNSLVSALNTAPGLNLQASLVNIGSNSTPDYRLSVQSAKLGATTIQVNDGSTDLLNTISSGSLASYKINGLTTPIQSDSRTVTLAPGITAKLNGQSAAGVATTVTVAQQSYSIGNALSALVTSYNAAADELHKNRGSAGGALAGNSLIQELGNKLRTIGSYSSGSEPIGSLAALGVTFDDKGHLSYDSSAFTSASTASLASVISFLGSSTTGGFLQAANNVITSVDDPISGLLPTAGVSFQTRITAQQALIDSNQARVDLLKTNLQAQLAKADAQVAALEQSYTVLTGLFQAQQYNNQNK